jgi:hypothetical protein
MGTFWHCLLAWGSAESGLLMHVFGANSAPACPPFSPGHSVPGCRCRCFALRPHLLCHLQCLSPPPQSQHTCVSHSLKIAAVRVPRVVIAEWQWASASTRIHPFSLLVSTGFERVDGTSRRERTLVWTFLHAPRPTSTYSHTVFAGADTQEKTYLRVGLRL